MCMNCNKAKVMQGGSGKVKSTSGSGVRKASSYSTGSNSFGKPKVRFSGRGR